jgi:hypothetical protein
MVAHAAAAAGGGAAGAAAAVEGVADVDLEMT